MNRKEEKAIIQEFFKHLFTSKIEHDKKEVTIEEDKITEEQMDFKRKVNHFYQS